MVQVYCVGCRDKKEITQNLSTKKYTTSKGRLITITCGTCPDCKGQACSIIKNEALPKKRKSTKN